MSIVDSVYRALRTHRGYFDYASHTPLDKDVCESMLVIMRQSVRGSLGNTSADHCEGIRANKILEEARTSCAKSIGVKSHEIIFTSGGTESNNIALLGAIGQKIQKGDYSRIHIVTSTIEHSSVRETIRSLEKLGVKVDWVPVNADGLIRMDIFKQVVKPDTTIVSVMYVNNEIGSVMPIREIAKYIKSMTTDNKPVLHIDACQAGLLPLDFGSMGVDLATLDGTKIYGPSTGLLYVRHGIKLQPILFGGQHEQGYRPGSGDSMRAHGLAKALSILCARRSSDYEHIQNLRTHFIDTLDKVYSDYIQKSSNKVSPYMIHGSNGSHQSPHIINIALPGHDAEYIMFALDARGVSVSTKSACERDNASSHVLSAMGIPQGISLRISFGRHTSYRDVQRLVKTLVDVLPLARNAH